MSWRVRAANLLTRTSSLWLIETRIRLLRVNRQIGSIKQRKRTSRIDVQGHQEIIARGAIVHETIITKTRIRAETITIATIEIRISRTTREEMAALAKLTL